MVISKQTSMNDRPVSPNLKQKGLKALDRQMLSYIVPPIMFPVHDFPGFCAPKMRYAETLKEPMLEAKREAVLPRELRRIRASALTGDKKYGSVMDVLQIVYGQDFGAILKDYVDIGSIGSALIGRVRASLSSRRSAGLIFAASVWAILQTPASCPAPSSMAPCTAFCWSFRTASRLQAPCVW